MKHRLFVCLLVAIVLVAAAPAISLAQSFQGLGFLPGQAASQALGVSADGSVVVGGSGPAGSTQSQAFRWTASTGMVGLGFLPGYNSSIATAASADGSVVVGYSFNTANQTEAFRWTAANGMVSLGFLPGGNQST